MVSKPWSSKERMRSQFSIVLVIHKLIEVDIIIITMTMIIIMILLMIMIFPRNRRDIFLLYYVKKNEERMHSWRRGSQDRTCDLLSLPIRSTWIKVWRVVCHLLCCFCQENIRLFLLASWKLPGAAIQVTYIFDFSFKFTISFFLFSCPNLFIFFSQ